MAKRTRKKDKKVTLVDVKEPNSTKEFFKTRNRYWEKLMRNAQMGELNLPSLEEVHTRLDEHARECGYVRDYNDYYPRLEPCRCNIIIKTGNCSTCGRPLFKEFPEEFPEEWKMCCGCKLFATWIVGKHDFKGSFENLERIERIRKLITLVG